MLSNLSFMLWRVFLLCLLFEIMIHEGAFQTAFFVANNFCVVFKNYKTKMILLPSRSNFRIYKFVKSFVLCFVGWMIILLEIKFCFCFQIDFILFFFYTLKIFYFSFFFFEKKPQQSNEFLLPLKSYFDIFFILFYFRCCFLLIFFFFKISLLVLLFGSNFRNFRNFLFFIFVLLNFGFCSFVVELKNIGIAGYYCYFSFVLNSFEYWFRGFIDGFLKSRFYYLKNVFLFENKKILFCCLLLKLFCCFETFCNKNNIILKFSSFIN